MEDGIHGQRKLGLLVIKKNIYSAQPDAAGTVNSHKRAAVHKPLQKSKSIVKG